MKKIKIPIIRENKSTKFKESLQLDWLINSGLNRYIKKDITVEQAQAEWADYGLTLFIRKIEKVQNYICITANYPAMRYQQQLPPDWIVL